MNVKITKSFVESQKSSGKWKDTELRGFGLKVTSKLKKVYIVENSVRGGSSKVTVTIGPHGLWSTENARLEAKRLLTLMAQGINPNEDKKRIKQEQDLKRAIEESKLRDSEITLGKALADYIESRGTSLKESTVYIYKCAITSDLKDWLNLPITSISKDMVEKRHREITQAGKKGEANHVMRILRAILTYASLTYQNYDGLPLIQVNPVKRLSEIKAWNQLERRQGIIKDRDLFAWSQAVITLKRKEVRDFLFFLLYTGVRKSEAANLKWEDIDFRGKTLLFRNTKNRHTHMLPLSPQIEKILKNREKFKTNVLVFQSPIRKGVIKDVRTDIQRIEAESGVNFILHDLRRTFITVAERLDIPYWAIKRLANHRDKSDVTSGYIVSDVERLRKPMAKISNHIERKLSGELVRIE